jgi:hypothetical protein
MEGEEGCGGAPPPPAHRERRRAHAGTKCGEEGRHGTHAAAVGKKMRGGPCATSEGYLQGVVVGASRRAHPSAPPPSLCAGSPMRHRATSLTANGTIMPERPRRHPPPLPIQRRARRLPRAPHTGWPRAAVQPLIPAGQRHSRGHCPSAGAIHRATITVQHLFPLTSGSGAPVQPPELWV